MIAPPQWSTQQFERDAAAAMQRFREERMAEPLEAYLEAFEEVRGRMEDLLETTVDLSQIRQVAAAVLSDPGLFEAARYLAGPPISTDDLKVLSEATLSPSSMRRDPSEATRAVVGDWIWWDCRAGRVDGRSLWVCRARHRPRHQLLRRGASIW